MRQKGFILLPILIVVFLLGFTGYFIFQNTQSKKQASQPEPTAITSALITPSPTPSDVNQEGTVVGKLCYPSSFIPKGSIEAKNIKTNKIYTQEYLGTANGGGTSFSIDLPTGQYFLRFISSDNVDGYHTTVCPTGIETACGDLDQRVLITADVVSSQTLKGYDLCDFYFTAQNAPKF